MKLTHPLHPPLYTNGRIPALCARERIGYPRDRSNGVGSWKHKIACVLSLNDDDDDDDGDGDALLAMEYRKCRYAVRRILGYGSTNPRDARSVTGHVSANPSYLICGGLLGLIPDEMKAGDSTVPNREVLASR